jgi:predicted DNA-binding ribbon-helix-helix protein
MDQREHVKKTFVIKRSILINGQKTSLSLEDEFWRGLHEVAHDKNTTVPRLVEEIDRTTNNCNLSSAIRVFVFKYFQQRLIKAAE